MSNFSDFNERHFLLLLFKMTKDTIILSFDTTGRQDSIALKYGSTVDVRLLPQGGSGLQSAILVPELQKLLHDHTLNFKDVTTLCTLTGPGSFTGIRIGLATAQGLKLATSITIFAPTALEVLHNLTGYTSAIDSLRGDFFVRHQGKNQILSLKDLKDLIGKNPITSTQPIDQIDTIVVTIPMAELLIQFYERCTDKNAFPNLEPFYIRTPEFAKKKADL